MYHTAKKLILASASPRRQEFFRQLNLNFTVQTCEIDETPYEDERPEDYVRRLAVDKAAAVGRVQPEAWVLGADTIVCLGNTLLGKPKNEQEALSTLLSLSGKKHKVVTSFCLYSLGNDVCEVMAVVTQVLFCQITKEMAENYIRTGEPMDKAGSYGIQGLGGLFVERIEGSYSSVVGLPLVEVSSCLQKHGVIIPFKDGLLKK